MSHFTCCLQLLGLKAVDGEHLHAGKACSFHRLSGLIKAKENGCLLEVNTGGVYRGYRKDFYPGPWLLTEWHKMGGKVIITSDAHDTASLTFGFDEAAEAVKAAGFSSVEVLTVNGFETQEL